jgi:geranylgeranyl pyrophosphate synthase
MSALFATERAPDDQHPRDRPLATVPQQRERILPAEAALAIALGNGRKPAHLKQVPPSKELREQIRAAVIEAAARLDKSRPLVRYEIELHARKLLGDLQLPESYAGWTMVALASAFWQGEVTTIPYHRRLLLLPHCLRSSSVCDAEYNELGLLCKSCGACSLADLRASAQRLGYNVMIAEGSPAVMKMILDGKADALLGVACLDVLEKSLEKILVAGIPCMAIPLVRDGCHDTTVDNDWIRQMVDTPYRPATAQTAALQTATYVHLMRSAARLFEPAELQRLIPRTRGGSPLPLEGGGLEGLDPLACTEAIAYDFLIAGGKHSRPFITLAAYDALTGGHATLGEGAQRVAEISDAARCVALAIEIFHKASLVHDDIEDGDRFRYGRPTLHAKHGLPIALNVGDFLIGLGYRTVAAQRGALGAEVAAEILAQFAQAHAKLCEGQGAELVWRDARQKRLAPLDALKIYALKTAPAFEAALLAGIRLAGDPQPYRQTASRFARHLGVAYQMINDLDDWQVEQPNKCHSGTDILGGRPTVLWALALEGLADSGRAELESLLQAPDSDEARIARARELYAQAEVYRQVGELISKHHQRAREAAEQVASVPLRRLLDFLADAILDRRPLAIAP